MPMDPKVAEAVEFLKKNAVCRGELAGKVLLLVHVIPAGPHYATLSFPAGDHPAVLTYNPEAEATAPGAQNSARLGDIPSDRLEIKSPTIGQIMNWVCQKLDEKGITLIQSNWWTIKPKSN